MVTPAFPQAQQSPQQEAPLNLDFLLERSARKTARTISNMTIPVDMNSDKVSFPPTTTKALYYWVSVAQCLRKIFI